MFSVILSYRKSSSTLRDPQALKQAIVALADEHGGITCFLKLSSAMALFDNIDYVKYK